MSVFWAWKGTERLVTRNKEVLKNAGGGRAEDKG